MTGQDCCRSTYEITSSDGIRSDPSEFGQTGSKRPKPPTRQNCETKPNPPRQAQSNPVKLNQGKSNQIAAPPLHVQNRIHRFNRTLSVEARK